MCIWLRREEIWMRGYSTYMMKRIITVEDIYDWYYYDWGLL